ncbi:hypothetical protein BDQ17DRAFT_1343986 [Cyathus striatus]|nr:hypothetical protein BDQ17DRAFT_1343986 [Cyathus striatus]
MSKNIFYIVGREDIRQQVRAEIVTQTRQQVSAILPEFIPVPLCKQVEENKQLLCGLRTSLANSESRTTNQMLQSSSLDEPFAPIYMPNGKISELFPVDLRSLLYYEPDDMRTLMKDYRLAEGEEREANWKTFLNFIGADFEVASAVEIVQHEKLSYPYN